MSMKNIEFQNPSIHELLAYWVILHAFRLSADFFQKMISEISSVSNNLDPDQVPCFVGHDLGPNCLRRH